ncbi:MAG: 2-dehydropantoate 2-reductase [Candidatus Nanopelagicales bacterium]
MLRYAVVGSGAVGGFYGIRLAHAGAHVQFLVRHGADEVRAHGLDLTSPQGDLQLSEVAVAADWSALAPCDVLLVAVKATANDDVLTHLRAHADRLLASDAGILLVQNGIGAEPTFAAAAPGREVLAGLAFLCAQRTGPHTVAHLDFGALTLAAHGPDEAPAGVTPLMQAIAADLVAARTAVLLDEDLIRARWRKLMWNIAFNPLSVILDATTDQIMADPDTVALARTLMTDVAAACTAEGRVLPDGLIDELLAATAQMAPYATSMKLDADAGRPLEVDAVLAEPLRRASRSAAAMPSVAVLYQQLAFLDARIRARAAR